MKMASASLRILLAVFASLCCIMAVDVASPVAPGNMHAASKEALPASRGVGHEDGPHQEEGLVETSQIKLATGKVTGRPTLKGHVPYCDPWEVGVC